MMDLKPRKRDQYRFLPFHHRHKEELAEDLSDHDDHTRIHKLLDTVASHSGHISGHAEMQIKKILMNMYDVLHDQSVKFKQMGSSSKDDAEKRRIRRAARRMLNVAHFSITNFLHMERTRLKMPVASLQRARADGLVPILIAGMKNLSVKAVHLSKQALHMEESDRDKSH